MDAKGAGRSGRFFAFFFRRQVFDEVMQEVIHARAVFDRVVVDEVQFRHFADAEFLRERVAQLSGVRVSRAEQCLPFVGVVDDVRHVHFGK